jgi:hypothetical protein
VIRRAIACLLVIALLTATSAAQPVPNPTVMVLPIDGDADPAVRKQLTTLIEADVANLGTVKAGTTTLGETAAAIGCDPSTSACAESVRTTLSVDVLIYGTASANNGQVELVITKQEKDKPAVTATQTINAADAKLDPVAMREITGKPAPVTCMGNAMPQPDGTCREQPKKKPRTERIIGISVLVGAGLFAIGGLTQWSEKSKKQELIDEAPTNTLADFQALEALEDDAAKKATAGNLLMLGAVAAASVGVYLLYRDRKAQREITVTPTASSTGAGVLVTIGAR